MEYLKKRRSLENYTVRTIPKTVLTKDSEGNTIIDTDSPKYYYGKIPEYKVDSNGNFILDEEGQKIKNTIDIDVFLTQDLDDMGLFSDFDFTPKNQTLTQPPVDFNSFSYGRLPGAPVDFYYSQTSIVTGFTDDRYLSSVKSYRVDQNNQPIYVQSLNTSNNPSEYFDGVIIDTQEDIIYKINANKDDIANTGLKLKTSKNKFAIGVDSSGNPKKYFETNFEIKSGGWDKFNTTLKANVKKEEYLGVVFQPEIDSVVFINRGIEDIFERHAILSEIKSTNDIDTNRGGFIRV